MYIGGTDINALNHVVMEAIDNSNDEFLAGFGNQIDVIFTEDGSVIIEDRGRGIPHGKNKEGKETLEVLLTKLHAGGKFGGEDSGYRSSGGLHGIGLKAANATSKYFKVTSYKDGFEHYIEYIDGGKLNTPVTKVGKTTKTGTKIHMTPDDTIFDTVKYSKSKLVERLKEKAFLMKGLRFVIKDERDGTEEVIQYEDGIKEYLESSNKDKKSITKIGFFEGISHEINVEVALQWVDDYNDIVLAFTNNVKNPDFGTHVNGFRAGLLKAINKFAKDKGHLKAKDANFQTKDVSEGLVGIVSVLVPENQLQFNSQTKDALNTPLAKNAVEEVLETALYEFLLANKKDSDKLMVKLKQNQKARLDAKKLRDKQKKQKGKKNLALDKLTPATGKDYSKNELFVVEGN